MKAAVSSARLRRLSIILGKMRSLLLAYSGGVDSTFLLKAAVDELSPEAVAAVTAVSLTYPEEELAHARTVCRKFGVRHIVIKTHELKDKRFSSNPVERCYYCKSELFRRLEALRRRLGLRYVADASNASDLKDFRPGSRAKKIFGVRSPLQEAGITKKEVRSLSRKLNLPTWNKPSMACLASRIPYGSRITASALKRISRAERFLRSIGFNQVRTRDYGTLCSIEVAAGKISALIAARNRILRYLKHLGYSHVTLDLGGYRTGSLNEALNAKRAIRTFKRRTR